MSDKPLYVAFVWHMHQPLYKNGVAGRYLLPWVRMHGIKDYFDMAAILEDFPNVRQTFNLTPVLMMQIEDYVKNKATDAFLDITMKKAEGLAKEDKEFILYNFFMANWDNMLGKCPRYLELLDMRGRHTTREQVADITGNFSAQDYLDLQVLFNLVWFDPMFLEKEPLEPLVRKGRDFTEEDKAVVIKRQAEVLAMIMPEYKKLQDAGQIEVTTSPFYHPILPLVYNTDIARIPSPGITLPGKRYSAPADAQKQVEKAVEFYKERFGRQPQGMWPSEGSVSGDIMPLMEGAGIKWTATDEGILENSLKKTVSKDTRGNVLNPDLLYKPYRFHWNGRHIDMIFRDHTLSDLIGFSYSKWKTEEAVSDFIRRLETINERTSKIPGDFLVPIILDGENAWEHYPNDGRDFLKGIYARLNSHPSIRCVTVSEFLGARKFVDTLPALSPGSWINRNFDIWIGDEEENTAWDLLCSAREFLVSYEADLGGGTAGQEKAAQLAGAWEEIYAAEGSDWNWWYGDQHTSGFDEAFDVLYRQHLSNVYRAVGAEPPAYLSESIILPAKESMPATEPVDLLRPTLDGVVTDYYEWIPSGCYEIRKTGGTMHQAESIVRAVYYGFDMENIYLRLDMHLRDTGKSEDVPALSFILNFISPGAVQLKFSTGDKDLMAAGQGERRLGAIAVKKIIEIKMPFADLGFKMKDEVKFSVSVMRNGAEMEHWPSRAPITFTLPSQDYKLERWSV